MILMKGIAHFVAGVAVASWVPQAVAAGAEGNPLYFVLGGCCGLLPDTLDFRLARFLYPHDVTVTPDPLDPDPQMIASAIAGTVNRAVATGRPVRLRLNTIRLAADLWWRYTVRFDVARGEVCVTMGPKVDTGGHLMEGCPVPRTGRAVVMAPLRLDYQAETAIDLFDGPTFRLCPGDGGVVTPEFIPWHRSWSHSLLAASVAGAGASVFGVSAAVVAFFAWLAHILFDQFGFLGSNWFFPWRRRRVPGWGWMHANAPVANFAAVWVSLAMIGWNLYTHDMAAVPLNPLRFGLLGLVLPIALFGAVARISRSTGVAPERNAGT